MQYLIYALAGISILLSVGGFGYVGPKRNWVLVASVNSIICSLLAIMYVSIWPLLIGFVINWIMRLAAGAFKEWKLTL